MNWMDYRVYKSRRVISNIAIVTLSFYKGPANHQPAKTKCFSFPINLFISPWQLFHLPLDVDGKCTGEEALDWSLSLTDPTKSADDGVKEGVTWATCSSPPAEFNDLKKGISRFGSQFFTSSNFNSRNSKFRLIFWSFVLSHLGGWWRFKTSEMTSLRAEEGPSWRRPSPPPGKVDDDDDEEEKFKLRAEVDITDVTTVDSAQWVDVGGFAIGRIEKYDRKT